MEESIDKRLAIAQSREKCYCQASGNSTNSGTVLLPDVWQQQNLGKIAIARYYQTYETALVGYTKA